MLLCIAMTFQGVAFGAEVPDYEIYSIEIHNGTCTLTGRQFKGANLDVELSLKERGGSSEAVILSDTCDTDGEFLFEFSAKPVVYDARFSSDAGVFERTLDFTTLFFEKGVNEDEPNVSYNSSDSKLVISGDAKEGSYITLKILKQGKDFEALESETGEDAVFYCNQINAGANGYIFDFTFEGAPGIYKATVSDATERTVKKFQINITAGSNTSVDGCEISSVKYRKDTVGISGNAGEANSRVIMSAVSADSGAKFGDGLIAVQNFEGISDISEWTDVTADKGISIVKTDKGNVLGMGTQLTSGFSGITKAVGADRGKLRIEMDVKAADDSSKWLELIADSSDGKYIELFRMYKRDDGVFVIGNYGGGYASGSSTHIFNWCIGSDAFAVNEWIKVQTDVDFDGKTFSISFINEEGVVGWSKSCALGISDVSQLRLGNTANKTVDYPNYADNINVLWGDEIQTAISGEDGSFGFEAEIEPGSYSLYLRSDSFADTAIQFDNRKICDVLSFGEDSYNKFTDKLKGYVAELEGLIAECESRGLTTDYESVNLELIRKFIYYIDGEAKHNDYERMGHYNYSLTRIYKETRDTLNQYLSGEKKPFKVPKYVTGDIRFDGTTMYGMTETDGVFEERPIYLSGYGFFPTVREETEFFSKTGSNIIQYGPEFSEMVKFYAPQTVGAWEVEHKGGCVATAELSGTDKRNGKYSLRITNPKEKTTDMNMQVNQKVLVKPNTTYTIGCYAKSKDSNGTILIRNWEWGKEQKIQQSDIWQYYSFDYTTGPFEWEFSVRVVVNDYVEECYVDDIFVREKGSKENLLVNGDFEDIPTEMTELEKEAVKEGWYINYYGLNNLRTTLSEAEENNVLVDVSLNLHYFEGSFILNENPEMTEYYGRYMPFTPDNEKVRKMLSIYIRAFCETIKDYDSVHSVMLHNEPQIFPNSSDYYKPYWADYLTKKYGSVSELNKVYGSSYANFADIEMPTWVESTQRFYDYRNFTEDIMTEYIEWVYKEVKTAYPEVKVHVKAMDYIRYDYPKDMVYGVNYERWADTMDINGCDAFSHFQKPNTPMPLKMAWYDYMTSLADKPVWDTESHPLSDGPYVKYDDMHPAYMAADVWNGATHGRGASVMWYWDDTEANSLWQGSRWSNANLRHRPDAAAKIAKTNLDMMRLSKEIAAISEVEPKIGILYSRDAMGYNSNHFTDVADAYMDIIFSGQRAGFVTDLTPEDVGKYELLIIPETPNVNDKLLASIRSYADGGGKILMMSDKSLVKDEYNKAHDASVVRAIYEKSDTTSSVRGKISELGFSELVLVDALTGEALDDVEWSYADYQGKKIVNIINYDYDTTKSVKLLLNGKEQTGLKELRTGTESSVLELKPYEPQLISVEHFTFELIDENGEVTESNLTEVRGGRIRCKSGVEGSLVLALYKDGVLVKVSTDSDVIEVPDDGEKYSLAAMSWDMESIKPNAPARRI